MRSGAKSWSRARSRSAPTRSPRSSPSRSASPSPSGSSFASEHTSGRAGRRRPARRFALVVDPVAFGDLAAPGAGLDSAVLDQLLEALEVGLDRTLVAAELLGCRFDDALGLPVHDHLDPRPVVTEAVEPHVARVLLALGRPPRDVAVGLLVGDLRRPLLASAADLGDPAEVGVVELLDRLDVLHELRELLELRPLVVRGRDRNLDFDGLFDLAHASPFLDGIELPSYPLQAVLTPSRYVLL